MSVEFRIIITQYFHSLLRFREVLQHPKHPPPPLKSDPILTLILLIMHVRRWRPIIIESNENIRKHCNRRFQCSLHGFGRPDCSFSTFWVHAHGFLPRIAPCSFSYVGIPVRGRVREQQASSILINRQLLKVASWPLKETNRSLYFYRSSFCTHSILYS